jgi:hypothetical protein
MTGSGVGGFDGVGDLQWRTTGRGSGGRLAATATREAAARRSTVVDSAPEYPGSCPPPAASACTHGAGRCHFTGWAGMGCLR